MSVNRGKDFEKVIKEAFEKVPNTSVTRLHDQTNGFIGSTNPCDFLMYHRPYLYAIECKSVHGNTLPFSNITKFQWQSLLSMSKVEGVFAGVLCWWIDNDVTKFIPIQVLQYMKDMDNLKSIRYDTPVCYPPCYGEVIQINGKKKRVFFEYDMEEFFKITDIEYKRKHINDIPERAGVWRE